MHGACSQTARTTGEFGLREGLATASGDMPMQGRNRHSKWRYAHAHREPPVKLASSNRMRCRSSPVRAGHGSVGHQGAGEIATTIDSLPFTGIASMAGRLLGFEIFSPYSFIKEEGPESA